jgi:hypothetical protein
MGSGDECLRLRAIGAAERESGARLFGDGFAGGLPGAEAAIEVVDVGEALGAEFGEGLAAATTASAVDEVGLGFIEFADLIGEGVVEVVDVYGFGDVAVFELILSADVQHHDFLIGFQQLGGGGGVHVFGLGCGGLGGAEGGDGQAQSERGDEEAEGE